MPTVFHEKQFRQRLTQGFWKLQRWFTGEVKETAVFVSCRKFDDSALVERREMWSKLAKIGSTDILESRASPKRNR